MKNNLFPAKSVTEREMAELLLSIKGRILITAHLRPDGDAAGAALGLWHSLRDSGRNTLVVGLGPVADTCDFLEGLDRVVEPEGLKILEDDVLVVVDCGTPSRLRDDVRPLAASLPVLCIDHHVAGEGFGGPICLEPNAGAASEIVHRVIRAAGLPESRACAEALWTGIATDTGRFCYESTSPATMAAAAELLALGVRSQIISAKIWGSEPLRRLNLKRRLLETLRVSPDGAAAICSLSPEDYAAEGCSGKDSENFVDIARSVRGVRVAAFVRQVRPGAPVNISLRSADPIDAAAICAEWGGGGHVRAAGATLNTTLADAIDKVGARIRAIAALR